MNSRPPDWDMRFWFSIVFPLTDARPHVHGRHEAVVAQAAVLPGNVGALASVADVRRLLTLIDI